MTGGQEAEPAGISGEMEERVADSCRTALNRFICGVGQEAREAERRRSPRAIQLHVLNLPSGRLASSSISNVDSQCIMIRIEQGPIDRISVDRTEQVPLSRRLRKPE